MRRATRSGGPGPGNVVVNRAARCPKAVALSGLLCSTLVAGGWSSAARAESLPELRQKARTAAQQEDWTAAADLYHRIADASPADGVALRALGYVCLRAREYDEAVRAYARAAETGTSPAQCYYDIACAEALAGRTDRAIDAMGAAYSRGFVDETLLQSDGDLVSLHDDPRFREIVGWPDAAVSGRADRWRRDLEFLSRRVREVHWRPFGVLPESEFDARIASMIASVDHRTDLELRAEVRRLLASIGDGHTAPMMDFFLAHHGAAEVPSSFLPFELFWFVGSEGPAGGSDADPPVSGSGSSPGPDIRVVAVTEEYARFAGARVRAIGSESDLGALLDRVGEYVSKDNAWGAMWGRMMAITDPLLLEVFGLGDPTSGFSFTLEKLDGTREPVTFALGGLENVHRRRPTAMLLGIPAGPALRNKREHLWMELLPAEPSVLYVRIDGIRDGEAESFADFTNRIFATAEESHVDRLVLDLRDNLGGQGQLWQPLLHRLIGSELSLRDHLYVLVGRKTFSAAMALAAQLEFHTGAIFVGEPTGSRPNFVGETSLVRLPYSGLWVSLSSRYHQNGGSNDSRYWIPPDIPAGPTPDAMLAGRDPALEAILGRP